MIRLVGRLGLGLFLVSTLIAANWSTRHSIVSAPAQPWIMPYSSAVPDGAIRTQVKVGTATQGTGPSYVVLIVLDGARPDYFMVPNIPHVKALMRNGTQFTNAWAGILESETPSGHATLGTGSEPRDDGILSFGWANSDNIGISLFDPAKIRAGMMEKVMNDAGAPSIARLLHGKDRSARVVALGGYKYYAVDAIGGPDADVIMYYETRPDGKFAPTAMPRHVPPAGIMSSPDLIAPSKQLPLGGGNSLAMKLASKTFQRMRQQVTLINLPEFDWPLGHVYGASRDPKSVQTLMQGFDRDLASLQETYRRAGVLDRTLFVLTSDHGFAPIYHHVPKSVVADAVTKTGTSIIRDTYHTGAYLWLKDETKAAAAAANIVNQHNPYIQSVYVRQLGAGGSTYVRATDASPFRAAGTEEANQYLLHTFNGPIGPDLVVFYTEEASGMSSGQEKWKGDHGGADWESQHVPLILSGLGVRQGYISTYPARLMDVAPTLLSLLAVDASAMQGLILADALQSPSSLDEAFQKTEEPKLQAVVDSLQAESRAETSSKQ